MSVFVGAIATFLGLGVAYMMRPPAVAPEVAETSRDTASGTGRVSAPTVKQLAMPIGDTNGGSETASDSKSAEVTRLVATGVAEDAFKAWSLLAACNDRRRAEQEARANVASGPPEWLAERAKKLRNGDLARESQAACGDISQAQIGERLKHLERAAEAGIPHAAFGLMREGPWGDPSAMLSRWDDPAVQAWVGRLLELLKIAAAKGDLDALEVLVLQHRDGGALVKHRDPAAALMYGTAHSIAYKRQYGREISQNRKRALDSLAAGLSVEQVEKERAAALQFLGGKQ